MTGALKRIRLPPDALAWDRQLGLVDWVGGPSWNKEPRFAVIAKVRETYTAMSQTDLADDPDAIVRAAYTYFAKDDEFLNHVLVDCNQSMLGAGEWEAVTTTYAWVVLQRYNRELGGEDG